MFFANTYIMTYFNYHGRAINLIKSNHCIYAEIKKKHNSISPALVLYFDNHPPMPIRQYKWDYYLLILNEYNIKLKEN